jgi:hypothetical protein
MRRKEKGYLDVEVNALPITTMAKNALLKDGIRTLEDIQLRMHDIPLLYSVGNRSVIQIETILNVARLGLFENDVSEQGQDGLAAILECLLRIEKMIMEKSS